MLSGLGVAGAVLAAIVVTFTLASGIVAYSLTSDDPLTPASGALVLDSLALRSGELAGRPIVLRSADATASARRSSSAVAAVAGGSGGHGVAHGSLTADPVRGGAGPGDGDDAGTDGGAEPVPVSAPPRRPGATALQDTTQAVGATTDSLARRLKVAAADTRDALRSTVGATTGTLARLLGSHPAR
jgi:hypothetical protein